jgi:hypothetical protein
MPSGAFAMVTKGNVVLYLDRELVEKSKELGFNLSKTFENHLKHLITQFSTCNSLKNFNSTGNKKGVVGLPVPEPKWVQNLTQSNRLEPTVAQFHWYKHIKTGASWGSLQDWAYNIDYLFIFLFQDIFHLS